jgi:hypothetical protein
VLRALIVLAVAVNVQLSPADVVQPAKKLVEWGWDEPDQVFMRATRPGLRSCTTLA